MKAIDRRLRRLEMKWVPPLDEERIRVVMEIRECRRRRLAARGIEFRELEDDGVRFHTIAETIRHARMRLRNAALVPSTSPVPPREA